MLSVVENGVDLRDAISVGDNGGSRVGKEVHRTAISLAFLALKCMDTVWKERPQAEEKVIAEASSEEVLPFLDHLLVIK